MFRPLLIVSLEVFQVIFVHLVYNPALFLHHVVFHSCYMSQPVSFVSSYFLVNWFYFQLFQNFFIPFVVKECVPSCSSEKFHLNWCQSFFIFFLWVQISLPYKRMGRAITLYTFIPENFWITCSFKMLCRIPSIWANLARFCCISSSFS